MLELKHLRKNGVTYTEHLLFALKIGCRLWVSSLFLILHSVIPIVSVPRDLNLESMTRYLQKQNEDRNSWVDDCEAKEEWF